MTRSAIPPPVGAASTNGTSTTGRSTTGTVIARIVDVIVLLRPGEVVSYGDVAATAGHPRQARLVGRVLGTSGDSLPWWRVVTASGRLVPGLESEQADLLRDEGVEVRGDRVVRARFGRFGPSDDLRPGTRR